MAKGKLKKEKKIPLRTCIACKTKANKFEMIRIVRTAEGEAVIDGTGKVRGRGANLCANIDCFEKAARKGQIENALELDGKLSDESVKKLRADTEELLKEREFRKGQKNVTIRISRDDFETIN